MKKGDIVTIYRDPITKTDPEGDAKLVKHLSTLGDGCEFWLVHFTDDPVTDDPNSAYSRIIDPRKRDPKS